MIAWRDEALNQIPERLTSPASTLGIATAGSRRSALVAIREFFVLSPMWLQGATAFASILFVALLITTALRFVQSPGKEVALKFPLAPPKIVEITNRDKVSDKVIETPATINDAADKTEFRRPRRIKRNDGDLLAKSNPTSRGAERVLSNEELRTMLVAEVADKDDEENVPRLFDLLYETN
jgi:hypothetical protein